MVRGTIIELLLAFEASSSEIHMFQALRLNVSCGDSPVTFLLSLLHQLHDAIMRDVTDNAGVSSVTLRDENICITSEACKLIFKYKAFKHRRNFQWNTGSD